MGSQNFKTIEKNGALHTVSNIMKNVIGSTAEAKVGDLFNKWSGSVTYPHQHLLNGPQRTIDTYEN